jgi:hypothetical protein
MASTSRCTSTGRAFRRCRGRPLFVETADFPRFSQQSGFAHHAYWGMLPDLWLVRAPRRSAVSSRRFRDGSCAGAVCVARILLILGAGGLLAVASALAFALNDNTRQPHDGWMSRRVAWRLGILRR